MGDAGKTNSLIPEIRNDKGIPTLYVKGEPFFALSGEIHNSSASSLEYMEEHVWKQIEGMHLNALIVPLYWRRSSRRKGKFDFNTSGNGPIPQAREHGMHRPFCGSDFGKMQSRSMCRDG